ncbi:MAG: FlgD immunoglobulin-like domain containing protein [Candidatus Latescibacteria bacterium]|nr:FlgD immunoglobulin-like domain containing protein [Candidatus Latescibacterota bacterium]
MPHAYALYANYPNPFNPTTIIPLAIPAADAGPVALVIYNALGQVVRRWDLQGWRAGFHQVLWDGRDGRGRAVGSGVYLVQLAAGEFEQVRKVMLLR